MAESHGKVRSPDPCSALSAISPCLLEIHWVVSSSSRSTPLGTYYGASCAGTTASSCAAARVIFSKTLLVLAPLHNILFFSLWSQAVWVQILVLPLTISVILGPTPWFPHLWNKCNGIYVGRIKWIHLHLAHSNCSLHVSSHYVKQTKQTLHVALRIKTKTLTKGPAWVSWSLLLPTCCVYCGCTGVMLVSWMCSYFYCITCFSSPQLTHQLKHPFLREPFLVSPTLDPWFSRPVIVLSLSVSCLLPLGHSFFLSICFELWG